MGDPDLEEASGNLLKLAEETGNWSLMWAELQRCATRVPDGAAEQRDVATFLLRRDIAAPFGTPVDALRAAMRAFALSGFNDAESAGLAKEAWQCLDDQQRAAAMEELCVPLTR